MNVALSLRIEGLIGMSLKSLGAGGSIRVVPALTMDWRFVLAKDAIVQALIWDPS